MKSKFKVGDKVRIIGNETAISQNCKRFSIGSEGVISEMLDEDVSSTTSIKFISGYCTKCENNYGSGCSWFYDELLDVEKIKEHNRNGANS